MESITMAIESKLISPGELKTVLPLTREIKEIICHAKATIKNILSGKDKRLLLIVGPCSIHDPKAAMEYAQRLNILRKKYEDRIFIIMRVYFEKPRTSIGWKGLINDPYMDDSCLIADGLHIARELLLSITALGLTAGMEMLDPLVSHYISDLATWVAIGARTSESQIHREFASGLDMSVGFKNGTDGSIDSAVNAIITAANQHCFLTIDNQGYICTTRTKGNKSVHLVLRGDNQGPNYSEDSIGYCEKKLKEQNLPSSIIVDCSHMNAGKNWNNQIKVWQEIIDIRSKGRNSIKGIMVESNLHEGNQKISPALEYGVSVTDECISWEKTEELIGKTYDSLI